MLHLGVERGQEMEDPSQCTCQAVQSKKKFFLKRPTELDLRAFLGFPQFHYVPFRGFQWNKNGQSSGVWTRRTEDKARPVGTEWEMSCWALLKYVWSTQHNFQADGMIPYCTRLPGRSYKLNWCLAAGQELVLKILLSKDFVWCS